MPTDWGTVEDGGRVDTPLSRLARTGSSLDIGSETVEKFTSIMRESKTLVASGPMGVFERDGFEIGTKTVLEAMANSSAFTVIGGGHLAGSRVSLA